MSSKSDSTAKWARRTGLWPDQGPSGEEVWRGGNFSVWRNPRAGEPNQPEFVLHERVPRILPAANDNSPQLRLQLDGS